MTIGCIGLSVSIVMEDDRTTFQQALYPCTLPNDHVPSILKALPYTCAQLLTNTHFLDLNCVFLALLEVAIV